LKCLTSPIVPTYFIRPFCLAIVLNFKNSGTLLDIGGGYGLYDLMLSENFKVSVIEPIFSQVYLKDIKYKVYKANFDDFQSEQKYDLILMLDILEHFKDPSEALSKAKSFLKKDGILVIQTPNYRSIMQLLVKNWSWWMVEDHKVLFSSQSLSKILKNNCLKKIYFETYEPWIDFKRNLDGNFVSINNSALRKFLKSIFFSLFIPVYFPYFLIFCLFILTQSSTSSFISAYLILLSLPFGLVSAFLLIFANHSFSTPYSNEVKIKMLLYLILSSIIHIQ